MQLDVLIIFTIIITLKSHPCECFLTTQNTKHKSTRLLFSNTHNNNNNDEQSHNCKINIIHLDDTESFTEEKDNHFSIIHNYALDIFLIDLQSTPIPRRTSKFSSTSSSFSLSSIKDIDDDEKLIDDYDTAITPQSTTITYSKEPSLLKTSKAKLRLDISHVFKTCPPLFSIYYSFSKKDSSNNNNNYNNNNNNYTHYDNVQTIPTNNKYPLCQLTERVGPIPKHKLIEMVKRHPYLMFHVLNNVHSLRSTEMQLCHDLQLSSSTQFQILLKKIPATIISKTNRQQLRSLFHYFKTHLKMTNQNIHKLFYQSSPQLLLYSLTNFQITISYFQNELRLSIPEISKMILIRPTVLTHSIQNKIQPTISFLQNDLKLSDQTWKRMIVRYPQLFDHPITSLIPKAYYLQSILLQSDDDDDDDDEIKDTELITTNQKIPSSSTTIPRISSDVSCVISAFPPILWLSESNINSKISFLKHQLDLDKDEFRDLLVTYPQIIGLSLHNNLIPKFDFFLKERGILNNNNENCSLGAGLTKAQLKEFVLYQPALLAYSLENRIKPRIQKLHDHSIHFEYVPYYLMSLSDDKFSQWLNLQTSSWSVLNFDYESNDK